MKTKTIITEITREDIVNLFSTAFYGSQWLSYDYCPCTEANICEGDCVEDKLAKILLSGEYIELVDCYAEDLNDTYGDLPTYWRDDAMYYRVYLEDVKNGLQKALDSDNSWWVECVRDLMTEDAYNLDQPRAETLCQIIMFGDEIYG